MSKDKKPKSDVKYNPDDYPDVAEGHATFRSGSTKVQEERRRRKEKFEKEYGPWRLR